MSDDKVRAAHRLLMREGRWGLTVEQKVELREVLRTCEPIEGTFLTAKIKGHPHGGVIQTRCAVCPSRHPEDFPLDVFESWVVEWLPRGDLARIKKPEGWRGGGS